AEGEPGRRLRIDRPWFREWEGRIPGEPLTVKPRPQGIALRELRVGELAVLTSVADANWEPMGPEGQQIMIPLLTMDWSSVWDTVIEIVDAADGTVTARRTFPQYLLPIHGSTDRFYSTREEADGHVVIEIWRLARESGL